MGRIYPLTIELRCSLRLETLSAGKRACMYDDEFRAKILFSQLETLRKAPINQCSYFNSPRSTENTLSFFFACTLISDIGFHSTKKLMVGANS